MGGGFRKFAEGFRIYFTPLNGVLFTFPSRYYALSVTCLYLALDDGAPGFPQGVSDPMVLGIPLELFHVSLTGLSPSLAGLPKPFCYMKKSHIEVPQHRKINPTV